MHVLNMLSNFNMFQQMKVTRKILQGFLIKSEIRKVIIIYFLCKVCKKLKFSHVFFHYCQVLCILLNARNKIFILYLTSVFILSLPLIYVIITTSYIWYVLNRISILLVSQDHQWKYLNKKITNNIDNDVDNKHF